jgi:hypothetical protein
MPADPTRIAGRAQPPGTASLGKIELSTLSAGPPKSSDLPKRDFTAVTPNATGVVDVTGRHATATVSLITWLLCSEAGQRGQRQAG